MATDYYTHNNGDRPLKVSIWHNEVSIYKEDRYDEIQRKHIYRDISYKNYNAKQIFIGKSHDCEMTRFSGAIGPKFDGNTILIRLEDEGEKYKYAFIQDKIYIFVTDYLIVSYFSPVGNSDVPYPYAFDDHNNCYLLIENVIICSTSQNIKNMKKYDDPYDYYYRLDLITEDIGAHRKPIVKKFKNISKFMIGDEYYTLRYLYNYSENYDRLVRDFDPKLFIIDTQNNKIELSKNDYINILTDFAAKIGVKPFYWIDQI